jgi:hypothetical protein
MSLLRRGIISSGKLDAGGLTTYAANTSVLNGTTQFYSALDSSDFQLTATNWTMSFNIKFGSFTHADGDPRLYSQRLNGGEFFDIYINSSGNIGIFSWNSFSEVINLVVTAGLSLNTFYNIIIVRTGSTITVYVDNSSVGGGSITGNFQDLSVPISIGRWAGDGYYVTGELGPFGIWNNKAFSGSERTDFYNSGKPKCWGSMDSAFTSTASVFYELAEWSGHTGQAIVDQTGNSNTLTNNNSITFTGSGLNVEC